MRTAPRTRIKVDDLDDLLGRQFTVYRLFPIGQPNARRSVWLVRWQSWRAGTKFQARFLTEQEAIKLRDHLASELERTAAARRAAQRSEQSTQPTKPHRSGGGGGAKQPQLINRREQVPGTDPALFVTITTAWRDHSVVFTVAAVTNDNAPMRLPTRHDTPQRARRAANKLYAQLTQENN
jgi:hypothetical protein